ncbi:MAG: hypothetical protein JOY71_31540, partial [Acetobacteraceae bacterium]|nr:hypothetical protein [Acetobacteraceae bacterium]
RDLGSFLKYGPPEDAVRVASDAPRMKSIIMGASQSGRMIRSFLSLGFNQDEAGRQVFDGAMPYIAAGRMPLNVRFGQPGRAWGQQIDHLYPGYDFPSATGSNTIL